MFLILCGLFPGYLKEGISDCRFTLSSAKFIYIEKKKSSAESSTENEKFVNTVVDSEISFFM